MRPVHWLYTIPLRLRSLFRWAQADQELDDELREHLERKTEEYVAQGMTQEEAHRRVFLGFSFEVLAHDNVQDEARLRPRLDRRAERAPRPNNRGTRRDK